MEELKKIGHLEKRNERHYVLPSAEKGYKVLRYEYDLVIVSDAKGTSDEITDHVVDDTVVYDIVRMDISKSTRDLLYSFFDINRIRLISVYQCEWLENKFFELTFNRSLYRETLPNAVKNLFSRTSTITKDGRSKVYDDGTRSVSDNVSIILTTQSFDELLEYVKKEAV